MFLLRLLNSRHFNMVLTGLIMLMCWATVKSTNHNLFQNSCMVESQASTVKLVINKYFLMNNLHSLFVDIGDTSSDFVTKILRHILANSMIPMITIQQNLINVFLSESIHVIDNIENSVGYIFFAQNLHEKCMVTENHTRTNAWNSRAQILLITEKTCRTYNELDAVLRDCWESFNILNLLIIFTTCDEPLEVKVFSSSYNPFLGRTSVHNLSGHWENDSEINLYPCKICDTHGYVFSVTHSLNHTLFYITEELDGTVNFRGPDAAVLDAVVKSFRGFVRVEQPLTSIYDSHKIYSKTLHANEMFIMSRLMSKQTYPSGFACFTALVPKARQIPKFLNFCMPFKITMWIIYVTAAVFIAILWKILTWYGKEITNGGTSLLEAVRLILWGGTQFKPQLFSQRPLLIMVLVFNIIFSNLYQGSLTSYLTTPHFYHDIDTFEELSHSDLAVSIALSPDDTEAIAADFDDSEVTMLLLEKMVFDLTDEEAFAMSAKHRNISRIVDRYVGQYMASHVKYFQNGQPLLHVMKDCYIRMPYGYMTVTPDNPFLARLSTIVARLVEGGLVDKWRDDHAEESTRQTKKITAHHEPTAITMEHIYAVLLLLFIGQFLASLLIVAEIGCHRVKQKLYTPTPESS